MHHATVDIYNVILETTEIIIIYDGSITEENTLQSFKEQQVSHDYILFSYKYTNECNIFVI
jgi:hypothetical protein